MCGFGVCVCVCVCVRVRVQDCSTLCLALLSGSPFQPCVPAIVPVTVLVTFHLFTSHHCLQWLPHQRPLATSLPVMYIVYTNAKLPQCSMATIHMPIVLSYAFSFMFLHLMHIHLYAP